MRAKSAYRGFKSLINTLFKLVVLGSVGGALVLGFSGRVVKIADGDTLTVSGGKEILEKIRLYGVDSPELSQPGGLEAKLFASELAWLKPVRVEGVNRDQYGRLVALVYLEDGRCLNEELVRSGNAWVYRQFCDRPACIRWLVLEQEARRSQIGLWATPNPTAPWNWRRQHSRR